MRPTSLTGLTLACVTLAAEAQTTNLTTRSLTLRECIDLAVEHNLAIQIQRYGQDVAKYTLKAAYGAYDPILSYQVTRTFVDQPPAFDPKKSGVDAEYELQIDTTGPGLTGRLPFGLTYGFTATVSHWDAASHFDMLLNPMVFSNYPPNGIRLTNAYLANVGVTLSQPLLKDSWIDLYRRTIQLNKKNLKISELAFKAQVMAAVTSVESNYYKLVDAREQVGVQRKALEVASKLLEQTVKRVKVGDLPPLDEKQ